MKLLVATRSGHKMSEIRQILAEVPDLDLLSLDDAGVAPSAAEDELEPFDTFEQNARSKAEHFHRITGLSTVADDSGLEVDFLGGEPGVRSKRFAPEEGLEGLERDLANNRHLLRLLQAVPLEERTARYVCVAWLVREDGESHSFRGEAPGVIVDDPRGSGGFGYDPHVVDPELGCTYSEMPAEEKNRRSHRGRAFGELRKLLAAMATSSP
ncbi:MAG TPA: non-canonical purine NTP pyrophosphatase [Longimicrobiales bacterium]|nr:non-canonical purine NTP pyrophosphatase [Longimicrobiales bacterium]